MIPPSQHSQLFYDAAPLAALPLLGLPMLGLSLSNGRKQLPLLCAPAAAFLLCGLFSGLLEEAAAPFWKILSTVTAFAESSALLLTAALLCMTGAGIIANVPLPPAALAFGAAYACANRTRQ